MKGGALTILYEDQRGPRQGFGLHALVKACVFDAVNGDRHRFEEALKDARPMKGADKLLRTCREEIDLIAADGRSVVALFDNDKIRQHLKLPQSASAERVRKEILKGCRAPEHLFVVLLEENTESVLDAAAVCAPAIDRARIERASKRKDALERDAVLIELSRERERPTRACILAKVPSFRAFVELICEKLRAVRRLRSGR